MRVSSGGIEESLSPHRDFQIVVDIRAGCGQRSSTRGIQRCFNSKAKVGTHDPTELDGHVANGKSNSGAYSKPHALTGSTEAAVGKSVDTRERGTFCYPHPSVHHNRDAVAKTLVFATDASPRVSALGEIVSFCHAAVSPRTSTSSSDRFLRYSTATPRLLQRPALWFSSFSVELFSALRVCARSGAVAALWAGSRPFRRIPGPRT